MGRLTLDIIGLAGQSIHPRSSQNQRFPDTLSVGFDYEFNSLQNDRDEFATAFSSLIATVSTPTTAFSHTVKPIIMALAPLLLKLVRALSFLFLIGLLLKIR